MDKKLRLLVTKKCSRGCPGCCNNDWNLDALPTLDFNTAHEYSEIMITGGEPLEGKNAKKTAVLISFLKECLGYKGKIFVYTARPFEGLMLCNKMDFDGITLTLHDQKDHCNLIKLLDKEFSGFKAWLRMDNLKRKQLRLNIFKGIKIDERLKNSKLFVIKDELEWIVDCKLPEGEVFMRLNTLFE